MSHEIKPVRSGRRLVILFLLLLSAGLMVSGQSKKMKKPAFPCLPPDVKAEEPVTHGAKARTVAEVLKEMKARCRKGKLVAPDNREIKFFRPACWGNPPADAEEILAEQNRRLEELKKKYHVIVFECDPMTP